MRFILFTSLFIFISALHGQTGINYQGVARNLDGSPILNQELSLEISIHKVDSTIFSERHTTNTNSFGLFKIVIGTGQSIVGSIDTVEWSMDSLYLKVYLNGEEFESQRINSVPISLYSITSGELVGKNQWIFNRIDSSLTYNQGNVIIGSNSVDTRLIIAQKFLAQMPGSYGLSIGNPEENYNSVTSLSNYSGGIFFPGKGWAHGYLTFIPHAPDDQSYFQLAGLQNTFNDVKAGLLINGKVGIGTLSPKSTLHVNGDIGLTWGQDHLHAYLNDEDYGYILKSGYNEEDRDYLSFGVPGTYSPNKTFLKINSKGITSVKILEIQGGSDIAEQKC